LEGIAPFDLSLILCKLSEDEQCKLSLDRLNSSVNLFNYSLADKNSRPPTLHCHHFIQLKCPLQKHGAFCEVGAVSVHGL